MWDFSVIANPSRQQPVECDVIIASDSGEIKHLMVNHLQIEGNYLLTTLPHQSALRLFLTSLKKLENQLILTLGGNSLI